MKIAHDITKLIGRTPLVQLNHVVGEAQAGVVAKLESFNPLSSVKDRIGAAMIDAAERSGKIGPDTVIVEPTSGNTGIGFALVGRLKGYTVRIVMPDGMSEERRKLIRALGADLILTPDKDGIEGSIKVAEEMAREDPRVFLPQQFENPENPRCHYYETAHELWRQMGGDIDCFVAGVGSGGTLQGVGTFLKEHRPHVKLVAVEPKNVAALLGHEPGLHQIQGIGDGFVPAVLDPSIVDEVIEVTDEDAIETTRRLGRDFGLLVGISSGANVWGARKMAEKISGNIATILPDRAERYFSTSLL